MLCKDCLLFVADEFTLGTCVRAMFSGNN